MGMCISWLLWLSHCVLLGIGGFGIWLSVSNFGSDELGPPTPPTPSNSSTTPSPYNSYRNNKPQEYQDYEDKLYMYSNLLNDPRLYMAVPSGMIVVTAALVVVVGLCSRKLFTTTMSLYSCTMLWILTLALQLTFQLKFIPEIYLGLSTAGWIVGVHVGILLLLLLQVVLGMWELRKQKAGWPTINLINIFTLEAVLLVLKLTAAVHVIMFFSDSQMLRGLRNPTADYNNQETSRFRYPIWLGISACVAVGYNLVATGEALLSFLLGTPHIHLTWITSLISTLCYGYVAVLASPMFIRTILGPYYISSGLMITTIVASIITFLHTMAYWFFPDVLRTPPKFVRVVADKLSTLAFSDILEGGILTGNLSTSRDAVQKGTSEMRKIMDRNPILRSHLISTVVSVVLICILSSTWNTPLYRAWGASLLLGVDVAVFCRSFPPVFIYFYCSQTFSVPFGQRAVRHVMEATAALIGCFAIFVRTDETGLVVAAVFNLVFYAILTWRMVVEYNTLKKATTDGTIASVLLLKESEGEAETEAETEAESKVETESKAVNEVEAEGGKEKEHENDTKIMHDFYAPNLVSLA